MTISIKHKFVNPKWNTADATVTRASNWNDEHDLTLAQDRVLGRVSPGNGSVEELTGSQLRVLSDTAQSGVLAGVNTRTASYTLTLADRGKVIEMNVAGANTVTVPNEIGIGGVNYPIGTQIMIVQLGAGQTTVIPASGVTLQSVVSGSKTTTPYSAVLLYKRAANDWLVLDQPYANANASAAASSATAAAASAALAGARADDIAALAGFRDFADLTTLLANTSLTYTAGLSGTVLVGEVICTRNEGFSYKVAASGATDHNVATAGGIKLYVLPTEGGFNLKAFGARGDNLTNDTAAVQAACAFINSTGSQVIVPPGTYLTDPIQLYSSAYALQSGLVGFSRSETIIKRRTTGAGAFVTIGSSTTPIFSADLLFSDITFDGGAVTNGDCVIAYELVRSTFRRCRFKGGDVALNIIGCVSVSLDDPLIDQARIGLRLGTIGGAFTGINNLLRVRGGEIVDNTELGAYLSNGRSWIFQGVDIEGNGTTLGAANQGGVIVENNVGAGQTLTYAGAQGARFDSCWFESNKGTADVVLKSGINTFNDCTFYSTATGTTNDILVVAGRYRLRDCAMNWPKTANIKEEATVSKGNLIETSDVPALSTDPEKTSANYGDLYILRNGGIPAITGNSAPLVFTGSDATGVNPTITFAKAFKSGTTPRVYVTPVNNSAGSIDAPEIYSVTNTGFTIRKKTYNGSAITTSNYTVQWIAVGEHP